MSKLLYKAVVEDIQNKNCTDAEIDVLLDAFDYTMKRMDLARKAWYELKDYATAPKKGIGQFTLMIERKDVLGQEQFYGVFACGPKSLSVIGTLESEGSKNSGGVIPAPSLRKAA